MFLLYMCRINLGKKNAFTCIREKGLRSDLTHTLTSLLSFFYVLFKSINTYQDICIYVWEQQHLVHKQSFDMIS